LPSVDGLPVLPSNTSIATGPPAAGREAFLDGRKSFQCFRKGQEIAVADFEKLSAFALTLPWIEAEYRATQAVLGPDIWPYGVAANRKAIDTLCGYLYEQGFTNRRMAVDELFAPLSRV
jgi:hypothetical protein